VIAVTHMWLEYPDTGGKAEFPVQAVEMWRARGWVDCESPPEPNLATSHLWDLADDGRVFSAEGPPEEPAEEPAEDVADVGEQGQEPNPTRSSRRKRGEAVTEEA
jgi:hypothetical protein